MSMHYHDIKHLKTSTKFDNRPLLTPTTVAGIKRSSASVRLCVSARSRTIEPKRIILLQGVKLDVSKIIHRAIEG